MNLDKKDEKQLFNLLSDSTLSNTYELEALFKKSGKKDIDRETWERIFHTLKKTNGLRRIYVNPTLEVYLENNNVRVSIIGNTSRPVPAAWYRTVYQLVGAPFQIGSSQRPSGRLWFGSVPNGFYV